MALICWDRHVLLISGVLGEFETWMRPCRGAFLNRDRGRGDTEMRHTDRSPHPLVKSGRRGCLWPCICHHETSSRGVVMTPTTNNNQLCEQHMDMHVQ